MFSQVLMVQQHIVVEEAVEELQALHQEVQEETEEVVQDQQIVQATLYLEQPILEVEAVVATLLEALVVVDLEL